MSKTWWVVMALQSWDSLSPVWTTITLRPGWIAAFDDRAKAEAWADGKTVVEVRIVE